MRDMHLRSYFIIFISFYQDIVDVKPVQMKYLQSLSMQHNVTGIGKMFPCSREIPVAVRDCLLQLRVNMILSYSNNSSGLGKIRK